MRVAVLFSGGKDSAWVTHLCLSWGWEVEWVTVHPQADSMMFHHPNTRWCGLQARAAGIRLHPVKAASHAEELADLERALARLKARKRDPIQGIVSGAVASEYQKQRIELIGHRLGLPTFAPLWHKGPEALREMLGQMEVRLVAVSAQGLDDKWLGRRLGPEDVDRLLALRPEVSPFLEGGEGETFVADAPYFGSRIAIVRERRAFEGLSGRMEIVRARLEAKAGARLEGAGAKKRRPRAAKAKPRPGPRPREGGQKRAQGGEGRRTQGRGKSRRA